jgi:7-cyano-7-deazaguanine synthase
MNLYMCFSGGLDSTVLLYHLIRDGHTVRPVIFDYGQRHYPEVEHALATAQALSEAGHIPGFSVFSLESIFEHFVNASVLEKNQNAGALLMANTVVPAGHYTDLVMKATIVPNRNMILASIVAGLAVARGYDGIACGVHAGDHAIYPDCKPDFWKAMESAFALGSSLVTLTPFIHSTKADIVRLGHSLHVPFQQTYSCYQGSEIHCGVCGTCTERREAFMLANVLDPTVYADKPETKQ